MSWASPVVLGALQGFTEFLPVSSTGHMAALALIFHLRTEGLALQASLHLGTLAAVVWLYRSDLRPFFELPWSNAIRREARLLAVAFAATVPLAFLLRPFDERALGDPRLLAAGFFLTTALLLATRFLTRGRRSWPSTVGALLVGVAQGLATFPGLSRSGSTVGVGLALGLEPQGAARFSFLLSIPAIVAASALTLAQGGYRGIVAGPWLLGVLVSAAFGTLSIRWVQDTLEEARLWTFAAYTAALAVLLLLLS